MPSGVLVARMVHLVRGSASGLLPVVAAAGLLAGCGAAVAGSHERAAVSVAGFRQALSVVYAVPVSPGAPLRQLDLFRAASGASTPIGSPANYTTVRWSPSGTEVAALAMGEAAGKPDAIDLVNPGSGASHSVALAPAAVPTFLSWAPNGSAVAVIGAGIELVSPGGLVSSSTLVPSPGGAPQSPVPVPGSTGYSVSGGGYAWSPGSGVFAAVVGSSLVLEAPGKTAHTLSVSALLPGLGDSAQVAVAGWADPSTLILEPFSTALGIGTSNGAPPAWAVTVDPTTLATTAVAMTVAPSGLGAGSGPPSLSPSTITSAIPGGQVVWARDTADGGGLVYALRRGPTSNTAGAPGLVLLFEFKGSSAAVPLPALLGNAADAGAWRVIELPCVRLPLALVVSE